MGGGHCKHRQTAYYPTVNRKFQRQNKTRSSGKRERRGDEGWEETEGNRKDRKTKKQKREKGTQRVQK